MATEPIKARLLTTDQAATYLNIPADTLTTWRHRGRGPAFVRINKASPISGRLSGRNLVRYPIDRLDEWITAMTEVPA